MSTELTTITIPNPLQVFSTPNGLDSIIDKIEAEVKSVDRDISTEAGRDNIRSLAFKLAKSKTFLDKMGKDLTEEQRAQITAVNAERKRAWERMEALQDEIRKPLTEWENRDKMRVAEHESDLQTLHDLAIINGSITPEEISGRIETIDEDFSKIDWEEFKDRAAAEIKNSREFLIAAHARRTKEISDAAELSRLRAEEEARQRREHDERVAKEAAEKATREAEERAARDAEIERQRVEKELHEAAERQRHIEEKALRDKAEAEAALAASEKKAADDAAAAAKALKDAQERAEREKAAALKKQADDAAAAAKALKDAQERAEREKAAALKKQADDAAAAAKELKNAQERAEREKAAALKKQQDDAAAAQKALDDAAAKRAADTAHKATINNAAAEKLNQMFKIPISDAKAIVIALAKGEIPNVTIKY